MQLFWSCWATRKTWDSVSPASCVTSPVPPSCTLHLLCSTSDLRSWLNRRRTHHGNGQQGIFSKRRLRSGHPLLPGRFCYDWRSGIPGLPSAHGTAYRRRRPDAIVGLAGFAVGILVGIFFLNKGFSLKRTYKLTTSEGVALPVGLGLLFVLFLLVPSLFVFSEKDLARCTLPLSCSHRRSGRWRTLPEIPYVYGSRYPRPGSV